MKKINEPEFIVSPAELKANQERSYAREYREKKSKRDNILRKLMWLLYGIIVVLFIVILNVQYKNAVEECVAFGNNRTFCEEGLR
jgi:hypothetical protein